MIKHEGNCTGNDDPFCLCPEGDQPVYVGNILTDHRGQWRVIGMDRSGQGLIVRGPLGQINTVPTNSDGTLKFPQHYTR